MRKIRYSAVFFYLTLLCLMYFLLNDFLLAIKFSQIENIKQLIDLTNYAGLNSSLLGRLIVNYLNLNANNSIFVIIYISISAIHFVFVILMLAMIATNYDTKQWDICSWFVIAIFMALCGMIVKLSLIVIIYSSSMTTLIALINLNKLGIGMIVFDGLLISVLVYFGMAYPRTIRI